MTYHALMSARNLRGWGKQKVVLAQLPKELLNKMQQDLFGKCVGVTLEVRGNVPSFKNSKMLITRDPRGRPLRRPMLITNPDFQKRMEEITESLRLQLLSAFQTIEGKTLTGCSLLSSIALSVPEDDCWTRIPDMVLKAKVCGPGEIEGATITIKPLR